MWDRQRSHHLVARFVRLRERITDPDSPQAQTASFWGELRQLEDRLGLSPMSMMRLQWEIDIAPGEGAEAEPAISPSSGAEPGDGDGNLHVISLRDRMRSGHA